MTMKIIYPVPEALPDSRARFIQIINTCLALARAGADVTLATGLKRGHSIESVLEFYGISPHPNLKILPLPMLRKEPSSRLGISWHGIFYFSLLLHLFRQKSKNTGRTIIFLRHLKLAGLILRFRTRIGMPLIFEVHEIFHRSIKVAKKKKKNKELEYEVYKHADKVICTSCYLKKQLLGITGQPDKIHVIRHGIKKEWFRIKRVDNPSYICYAGSLYRWKGVDTLISAMKYLAGERLVIVGGGGRLNELRGRVMEEGMADRIDFPGRVSHDEIPKYLSGAKAAVLPNIPEDQSIFSSPLKLFEYMACGVPVIASDFPVFREILHDHGNCLLFKAGNPRGLAECIKELNADPELAAKIAENAKQDAKNLTYSIRAQRILDVAESIFE